MHVPLLVARQFPAQPQAGDMVSEMSGALLMPDMSAWAQVNDRIAKLISSGEVDKHNFKLLVTGVHLCQQSEPSLHQD